ncbi:MAG: hypothetical protein ABMB14_00645 [Myxococcota bacterium]
MDRPETRWTLALLWLVATGCAGDDTGAEDTAGADPDAGDADSDADADSDTDSDADTDTTGPDLSCADEIAPASVPAAWTGTTVGQGDDVAPFCVYQPGGEDRSFAFTAPADGGYRFTADTPFVTLSMYDGCGGEELACGANDGYSTAPPSIRHDLVAGESVLVVVDTMMPGFETDFVVTAESLPSAELACDDGVDEDVDGASDCADPDCSAVASCQPACPDDTLVFGVPVAGTTLGQPDEGTAACDSSAMFGVTAPDRSYAFTAPTDGRYGFALTGLDFDAVLSVTDGCGGAELACLDFFQSETVTVELVAGQEVLVVVDGYVGQQGTFTLTSFHPEATETDCADGIDNDGYGLVDCWDAACTADPACDEDCANGVADNGTGIPDCQQLDRCGDDPACAEVCANGVDDNFDYFPDCSDSHCVHDPACVEDCANGVDDDADDHVDCDDGGCAGAAACPAGACPEFVLDTALPVVFVGDNAGASDEYPPCGGLVPSFTFDTADRTHAFVAPADGVYRFDLAGTAVSATVAVYDGCGGAALACDGWRWLTLQPAVVEVPLVQGQRVIAVVDGATAYDHGPYTLTVSRP